MDIKNLQTWLEPGLSDTVSLKTYLSTFKRLQRDGVCLKDKDSAIYIYENHSSLGIQRGVWTLTHIDDYKNGTIILHEQTLSEHENKIKSYRKYVGIEGEPILLTYHAKQDINLLMDNVIASGKAEVQKTGDTIHKLWKITDHDLILLFQHAFSTVNKVYLADGHHRLAAAVGQNSNKEQWISSLYISTDQLRIREFNRLIIPDMPVSEELLIELIFKYFHVSKIPNNRVCQPNKFHRVGMCLKGLWYQLDLKQDLRHLQLETDTQILQDYIFLPFFGINDPRTDTQLQSLNPIDGLEKLVIEIEKNKNAIAFTLFPLSVEQFLSHARMQKALPPKSTWIEPKIPYGLLMYCSHE